MRIACIHIPQYALQCATRFEPSLRHAAAVVVGTPTPEVAGPQHAPLVTACSRAAWHLGVRLGMTATMARSIAPSASFVGLEPALERETQRAVAEALMGLTPMVDLGSRTGPGRAHLAMYAEIPANMRGASFGNRALERLEVLGISCRIGIADDRFTAWVAASHGGATHAGMGTRIRDVTVVPRGSSAAFLAPLPLTLLQISLEVQQMLEALGVQTLGQFADLPSPSIAPRPQVYEADYQALARGESGTRLRPYTPQGVICEDIVVAAGNVLDLADGISAPTAVSSVARRIALRLEGRGSVATHIRVVASTQTDTRELDVELDPTNAADQLARAITPTAAQATAPWRLRVVVVGERSALSIATAVPVTDRKSDEFHAGPASAAAESTVHPLALVLSTSGALFSLSSPKARAHRRTRRSKQRRMLVRPASAQSQLFGAGDS